MRSAHCAGQNKAAVAKVRAARVEVRCCSMLGESPSVPLRCIVRATDCCLCPECATEVLDCQDSRRLERTCENFEENSKFFEPVAQCVQDKVGWTQPVVRQPWQFINQNQQRSCHMHREIKVAKVDFKASPGRKEMGTNISIKFNPIR